MKRVFASLAILAVLPINAFAIKTENTLTLVNHYSSPLTFSGRQNATDSLPDFSFPIVIDTQGSATSKVVTGPHGYVRGDGEEKHSVFFGVEVVNDAVVVHGYISKGIAYSWKKSVITFCTPEDYKKKGFCE